MKVVFYASQKEREIALADAFVRGCVAHSIDAEVRTLKPKGPVPIDVDVVCMVGVKSRELWRQYRAAGIHTLYFDKSYSRNGWNCWRVSINAHHPTALLGNLTLPSDRFDRLKLDVKPWRAPNHGHILFAGSSAKYHEFYSLLDPTAYASRLVKRLAKATSRGVIYRPKPSWTGAVAILGTIYSPPEQSIQDVLRGAHALVTHGSNACFEAMLAGVPSIILGDAVAKPISSTDCASAEDPRLATDEERRQLLSNIAYFQWTLPEMASGEAWQFISQHLPYEEDGHFKSVTRLLGIGHSYQGDGPLDTLNRLFHKTCGEDAPWLTKENVTVTLEKRPLATLVTLARPASGLSPASTKAPIVLVNYLGTDHLIDGSKRVHLWNGNREAFPAYVVTV